MEASIVEAFVVQEITNFISAYFSYRVRTKWTKLSRYGSSGTCLQNDGCTLDIFRRKGTLHGRGTPRDLNKEELNAAMLYILTNCTQVDRFKE